MHFQIASCMLDSSLKPLVCLDVMPDGQLDHLCAASVRHPFRLRPFRIRPSLLRMYTRHAERHLTTRTKGPALASMPSPRLHIPSSVPSHGIVSTPQPSGANPCPVPILCQSCANRPSAWPCPPRARRDLFALRTGPQSYIILCQSYACRGLFALRTARRARTAAASASSACSVDAQSMHGSVTLMP